MGIVRAGSVGTHLDASYRLISPNFRHLEVWCYIPGSHPRQSVSSRLQKRIRQAPEVSISPHHLGRESRRLRHLHLSTLIPPPCGKPEQKGVKTGGVGGGGKTHGTFLMRQRSQVQRDCPGSFEEKKKKNSVKSRRFHLRSPNVRVSLPWHSHTHPIPLPHLMEHSSSFYEHDRFNSTSGLQLRVRISLAW